MSRPCPRRKALAATLALGLVAQLACSDAFRDVSTDDPADGSAGDADADGDADGDSDTGSDTVCDEQNFPIALVPPHLMILLDASSSMTEEAGNGMSKWDQAIPAIQNIVASHADQILFGFDTFPNSGANCDVDDPIVLDVVQHLADNVSEMGAALAGASPSGASTPLYCAMAIMDDDGFAPVFMAPDASRYLVVVSDGADLCGEGCCVPYPSGWPPLPPPECVATTEEFAALAASLYADSGIRQYAIGFDAENVSESQLNAIAANGGTEVSEFILATDQAELEMALDNIAQTAVSCVYEIASPDATADPDNVNFYFDDVVVPYDEGCAQGVGWTWTDETHTAVEFCAAACAELQSGEVEEISAMFGCPTIEIE